MAVDRFASLTKLSELSREPRSLPASSDNAAISAGWQRSHSWNFAMTSSLVPSRPIVNGFAHLLPGSRTRGMARPI
jgi:hypothetical protein